MRLLKNKRLVFIFLPGLFLPGLSVFAREQPSRELLTWQKKYPESPVVSVIKNLDVTINLVNNSPETTLESYREMIVLTDNASSLANSKEYFNNHFDVKKLEAYSMVPVQNQYKKIQVSEFTRSIEMDDYVFYDDQYVYNYSYPAVGKGTKLVTKSLATTNYAYVPIIFDFGGYIPNESMQLTLSCPSNVRINYRLFGRDTCFIQSSCSNKGNRVTYTWKATNPRYYETDDKAPDSRYYIPHLIIQIAGYTINNEYTPVIGSLEDLYAYKYSHIRNLTDSAPQIKQLADSLTHDCDNDREKIRKIFTWVQKHIKYVAIEDGNNGYVPCEASLVLQRRYGDCKGKTSLLVAMIRSLNMKASYAWVGSREKPYKYSEFASVVNSNHMIAVWWDGDIPVILDGTTFSHRMEDVPAFIQGKECLIENGSDDFRLYTIPIAHSSQNAVIDSVMIEVRGDTVTGKGHITYFGENRARMQALFEGKDTFRYREILHRHISKASNKHIITSVTISDIHHSTQPFQVDYEFILPDYLTRVQHNLYLNLNVDKYMQQTVISEDRAIPLEADMTHDYQLFCILKIPEGFRVMNLPDSTMFDHPAFGFYEKYTQGMDQVILDSKISINFQVIDGNNLRQFREMLSLINRNYSKSLSLAKTETL